MREPVHEGNLDDDAREQRLRSLQRVNVREDDPCACSLCFLLRRLDDARAQHPPSCPVCKGRGWIGQPGATEPCVFCDSTGVPPMKNPPPNLSAPVRSAPASRARDHRRCVCLLEEHEEWCPFAKPEPVRVEVRPVIDATPRTPPLGHWWTTLAGLPLYDVTVSTACVVDGCGLGPREHE